MLLLVINVLKVTILLLPHFVICYHLDQLRNSD